MNRLTACLLLGAVLLMAGCSDPTGSEITRQGMPTNASEVVDFDAENGEFPEGVTVDKRGDVYVSLAPLGQLEQIASDGERTALLDPPLVPGAGLGLLGLTVDAPGNVYAAFSADGEPGSDLTGVYRITSDGAHEHLPGTEAIGVPNDVAFDKRGNLYVTDTVLGAVWRVDRAGDVTLWLQDDLLEGTGAFGFGIPLGANGIAYRHGVLYVAVTEKGHIVRVPVESGGVAGEAEVLIASPELVGVDGVELDVHGNIWAVNIGASLLVRVAADGSGLETWALPELDNPSSLAFGTGKGDRQALFIVNFALLSQEDPGLIRVDVGVPGLPVP